MRTRIIFPMVFAMVILYSCGKTDRITISKISSLHSETNIEIPSTEIKDHSSKITKTQQSRLAIVNENQDDFIQPINSDAGISSPAPQFDVPLKHYTIDAATGGTFTYRQTGSTVTIPQDALEDEDGNLITGMVDIEYRELHTQKEIFFSGIPMHYDVNGERQYFESAGMLEIKATQNKKKLRIKKGKNIRFKMSTDNTHDEVMLYELDPIKKEWKEIDQPKIIQTNIGNIQKKYWGPIYKTEKQKVDQPGVIDFNIEAYGTQKNIFTKTKEKYVTFNLNVDMNKKKRTKENKEKYTAAKIFNSVSYTVTGYKKSAFKKLMATIGYNSQEYWNYLSQRTEIYITGVQAPDKINLRFRYYNDEFNFDVTVDYNRLISPKMKNKYYDQLVNFSINEFDGRMYPHDEMVSVVDHYDSIPIPAEYYSKMLIQREFTSQNFGILNCDQPQKLPDGMIANAEFTINGAEFKPYDITLVDFKKNCMFTYYQNKFDHFKFNPDTKNFVFGVAPDGKVAYILPEEFKKIQKNGSMIIHLRLVEIEDFNQIMEDLFPTKDQSSYETLI